MGARGARALIPLRIMTAPATRLDVASVFAGGDCPLFPLPYLSEFTARAQAPRSSGRSAKDRSFLVGRANEAIAALNILHGDDASSTSKSASSAQRSALKHVWRSTKSAQLGSTDLTEFGAARELLNLGKTYDSVSTSTKTVSYQKGCVSLPAGDRSPVDLARALPHTARHFLEDFDNFILHDDLDMAEAHDHASSIKSYCDPAFNQVSRYHEFISDLADAGILTWTRSARGRCTPFFVPKKQKGSMRLVLDCRQVNCFFRQPPGCEMGSLSALAEIEVDLEGAPLRVSQTDIQNCFWQCKMPHRLSQWFCLMPVSGKFTKK